MRAYLTRQVHCFAFRTLLPALIVGALFFVSGNRCQGGLVFSDSFEGPGLDPFWITETSNGSITVPSPEMALSGANSAKFDSTSFPSQTFLRHNFATPVYGTASVWMFDGGADNALSNYMVFQMFNFTEGKNAYIQAADHGGGPDGSIYLYDKWNSDTAFNSTVDRTQDWHKWEMTSTPTAFDIRVDGTLVFSDSSGLAIDMLRFGMYDGYDLNLDGYFDNFSFVEYDVNAVPEPTSMALLGFASLGGLGLRWRQRQKARVSQAAV